MKITRLSLGLLLVSLSPLAAQVSVEVVLEQDQFLRDESLPVKVRITNRSGQTLNLGKEADWLRFTLESRDGGAVSRLGDAPVMGEFSLESSLAASKPVDLMPYFDLSKPGRYTVTATVKIKQWNQEVSSRAKDFEIVRGTKLWEQEFGVPVAAGPPEVRKYALQQANYLKRLLLYVRLTDPDEGHVFRVFPVGPLVSFSKPETQLDKENNLHLLFQTGARSFAYAVVSPNGEVILRQTHDYTATRPVLRSNEAGKIFVAGGLRRAADDDLPLRSPPASTNDVPTPKP